MKITLKMLAEQYAEDLLNNQELDGDNFFSSSCAGLAEARNEILYLLCHVLGRDKVFVLSHMDYEPNDSEVRDFYALYARRKAGEPLAYLTGIKEFYGYDFYVDSSTLIPRPETEMLVDEISAYSRRNGKRALRICDLGSGSGCILLAALLENKEACGIGIDINGQAVALAQKNAEHLGCAGRSRFMRADFAAPQFLQELTAYAGQEAFDCVVSNPPYIPASEYVRLDISVRCFEPQAALLSAAGDTEAQGLFHIQAAAALAKTLLNPGGLLLIEHGYNQGRLCRELCAVRDFVHVRTLNDLNGCERVLYAIKK